MVSWAIYGNERRLGPGPASVASGGPTPPTLPGSLAWYMADSGVTTAGGNVTAVADYLGNGSRGLTNFGTVPYVSSGAGSNNKPYFNLGGAVGGLHTSSGAIPFGTGTSGWCFAVFDLNSAAEAFSGLTAFVGNSGSDVDWSSAGSASFLERYDTFRGVESTRLTIPALWQSVSTPAFPAYDTLTLCLSVHDADGDVTGGTPGSPRTGKGIVTSNGTALDFNGGASAAFAAAGKIVIGARDSNGAGSYASYWKGKFCEAAYGNGVLTAANVAAIISYVTSKYGTMG